SASAGRPCYARATLQENRGGMMSMIARRAFLTTAARGIAALAGGFGFLPLSGVTAALTQERPGEGAWPNRPVRFIVPLAPGGGFDFVARVIGGHMSRELGQQIFIENRTGAGGTLGIELAVKSPPDGYSVLVTNDNVASAPHVMRLSVDYLNDLLPVSLLGRQPQALAVHPSLTGINSVADLIALIKQKPGLGCATSGVGSNPHVLVGRLHAAIH